MDPQTTRLIDVLNCPRLRRYARYVWQTQRNLIGIPVSPQGNINMIASDLVLLVLQKVLPRGYMRKYLMEIISFDEVAAIFRNWRDLQGENIMHLAVAQYDLGFVKLLVAKCGEDLLSTPSNSITSPMPLCGLSQNQMTVQYNQIEEAIEYYISEVPNGLSWIRSGVFQQLSEEDKNTIRPTKFIQALFDRPVVASEITEHEKSAVQTFFSRRGYYVKFMRMPDVQRKFRLIFLLSGPKRSECMKYVTPETSLNAADPIKIQSLLKLFEEINSMKQLTIADRGMLLALTEMMFEYITSTVRRGNTIGLNVQHYIQLLWNLNDSGALQTTKEDVEAANEEDIDPFLVNLSRKPTIGVQQIRKFQFHKQDLPAIYKEFTNMYMKSWFSGPIFGSTDQIPPVEFPLMDLPRDILTIIGYFLSYRDFTAFSLTNKQLQKVTKKSTIVWRAKFEQYFPYDTPPKEYSQSIFNGRYKQKFQKREIAGRYTSAINIPLYCNMKSTELYETELLYSSTYHKRLTLFDIATKRHVSVENLTPTIARIHRDKVIAMRHGTVEVLDKGNLEKTGEFPRIHFSQSVKLPYFALSNNLLISSDCLYDWHTGQSLTTWADYQQVIVVRDQMSYGIDGTDILVRDLRQAEQIQQKVSNPDLDQHASMNVFDGKIYTAGKSISVFDTRYLQTPLSTVKNRSIGPCERTDRYAIDLVNMTVWGSQVSWDLIDNKWEHTNICEYGNTCDKLCNGQYLAVLYDGVLAVNELNGSTSFPYGDLNVNRN